MKNYISQEEIIYWVWLQWCIGMSSKKIHDVFEKFGNGYGLFSASEKQIKLCKSFSSKSLSKVCSKDLKSAYKIVDDCVKLGYDIIPYCDVRYPDELRQLCNSPAVLYVNGKIPDKKRQFVSMVGTREPSQIGKKSAYNLSYNLSRNDVVIVSGGALGIDTQCHKGALAADGITVCVLGCGINTNYIMENYQLRNEIAKKGAVISEYPPYYPAFPYNFISRNRIIAALSKSTIVVECGLKSGALVTAREAVNQGKEIFAVPGRDNIASTQGSNALLDNGALPAESFLDVLNRYREIEEGIAERKSRVTDETFLNIQKIRSENLKNKKLEIIDDESYWYDNKCSEETLKIKENFSERKKSAPADKKENKISSEVLTSSTKTVYDTISDIPVSINDLSEKINMPVRDVMAALSELELYDVVESVPGKGYKRK